MSTKITKAPDGTWQWKILVGGLQGGCGGFKTEAEARKDAKEALTKAKGWGNNQK